MAALSDQALLARLVGFDSVSAKSNAPIAGFVSEYLRDHGGEAIRIERFETEDAAGEAKVNLLASCGPSRAGNKDRGGLILCGHLDVVPADEPGWTTDPFTLTERDGALIGRGAADMKGFDALAINLLLEAAQQNDELAHPLLVLLSFDEEVGSIGAKHFSETYEEARMLPRACIIGEPTSLRVVRMHKGHLAMRITTNGKAAHSGSPHLGRNAIEPAGAIITALRELRKRFEQMTLETSRFFSSVPHPVLSLAAIHGGGAINVIPDVCTIDLGIRLMPGQERDAVVADVERIAREAAGDGPVTIELVRENPPLLTRDDAPLHTAICELAGQRESIGVSYASDGGWLSTLGLDCVLFGPGTIEVAHKPDEALPIDEFRRGREMLRTLIERFCIDGPEPGPAR